MGDVYSIPNYCGPNDSSVRQPWCSALGAEGEWKDDGEDFSVVCYFNSRAPGQTCPGTCIQDGAPSMAGGGAKCKSKFIYKSFLVQVEIFLNKYLHF